MSAITIGGKAGAWLFEVVVPGQPVGKGRPRASIQGRRVRMRTPAKTAAWEALAASWCRVAWRGRDALDEAVEVEIVAVLRRPARLNRKRDAPGRLLAPVKPDVDNVAKACIDSIVLAGVIVDDNRVVRLTASKWYAAKGEEPRVEMRLRPFEYEQPNKEQL